jgi:MarR family transcriptional regulator, transcriptional regulator for hemolysin
MKQNTDLPLDGFGMSFVVLARRWRRALEEALAREGHADATWVPLVHLADSGEPLCQRELALRAGLDGSSLVRLLDLLAARGLIERRTKLGDRRANLLHLTEAGRVAAADVRRILAERESEMVSGVAEAELRTISAVFERISRNLSAHADTETHA